MLTFCHFLCLIVKTHLFDLLLISVFQTSGISVGVLQIQEICSTYQLKEKKNICTSILWPSWHWCVRLLPNCGCPAWLASLVLQDVVPNASLWLHRITNNPLCFPFFIARTTLWIGPRLIPKCCSWRCASMQLSASFLSAICQSFFSFICLNWQESTFFLF